MFSKHKHEKGLGPEKLGSQPLFGLFLNPVPLFMNSRQLNTIALSTCFQVLEKSIFLEMLFGGAFRGFTNKVKGLYYICNKNLTLRIKV